MKKSDLANIKKMAIPEITQTVGKLKDEYSRLVIDKSMGKLTDVKLLKKKRQGVAQVLTVWRQKQLLEKLGGVKSES